MLVIDNKPGENPELHQMADDGRGNKISIPSFMISLADGRKLIKEIHDEEKWEAEQYAQRLEEETNPSEGEDEKDQDDEEPISKDEDDKKWKIRKHKRKGWGKRVII